MNGIIRGAITSVFLLTAVAHAVWPTVTIDSVTVTLLVMASIPWLGRLFTKLEIPGILKLEGRELQEAADPITGDSGIQPQTTSDTKRKRRHVYAFETVAAGDRNMVLAGLRIELEKRLKEIARSHGIASGRTPLGKVIGTLASQEIIRREEASALSDLLPLLNRAVHGATVDRAALEWALSFGPPLLDTLDERIAQTSLPDLIAQWRQRDGASVQEVGTQLSKSLVTAPRAFLQAMANDPESFDSWLEDIETHTFTLFESSGELEDDLYTAYYDRLKTRMEERLGNLLGTDLDGEASRVLAALDRVAVQRIW